MTEEKKQREQFPIANTEEQDVAEWKSRDDSEQFLENIDGKRKNQMVPPPPPRGTFMTCQVCGQIMMPEHFSKIEATRKREFKWHIHEYCMDYMEHQADLSTPGLLSERKRIEKARKE